jgi:uncharacterized YccA/Bax inhibitor family protein
MTLAGTANKTLLLLLMLVCTAAYTWTLYFKQINIMPYTVVGGIGAFIIAWIAIFVKRSAVITAPLYALFKGLALGGISAYYEASYPGIVFHVVSLTVATLFGLLLLYRLQILKATANFRLGVISCTCAIFVVYLIDFILHFFGIRVPFIHETGLLGIGISVFIVIIAALNLVLDFDFIESGVEEGAPKYMEWYSAFGLILTLVWLYIEILRLLTKIRRN